MIDQQTIQRIVDTAKIEEVIGEFVSLKKRGANHIGCCPFHNEKTPSFYVSPSKGIYKCFGCGEAGDVIKFLRKHEHYSYVEALRWLAEKYNIEVHEVEQTDEEKQRGAERDSLFHASEYAQKYFADLLWNDEMGRTVGLSYFRSRGMSDEIIKRFGLGYCLDEWSAFTDHALHDGYSLEVLEKTGLTIVKSPESESSDSTSVGGVKRRYDRFRSRVMFPIYSISGRVIGFSGRVLGSGKQAAKYVNSPDSEIYNKSHVLYGLYQARGAIGKADKCYLVEGNIDVISMHQSGVENTVASCGTSLTVEQARLIKRFTPNVTIVYDGDSAGIKAALRAVNILFAEGLHVRVVLFPDGDDPDSYAQKHGSAMLQEYLSEHEDNFIMFRTRILLEEVKNDPIRKAELLNDTAQTISIVADPLERQEYIRRCSHLLTVREDVLTETVARCIGRRKEKEYEEQNKTQSADNAPATQPQPDAYAPDQSAPSQPQPQAVPAENLPPSPAEKHLIELILRYGNHILYNSDDKLVVADLNSKNSPDASTSAEPNNLSDAKRDYFTVAQAIVSDLKYNGMTFSNPLCQRIYEQCALMLEYGGEVKISSFTQHSDDALRVFAISLMVETDTLSKSWKERGISVPTAESNLYQDVFQTLQSFKKNDIRARKEMLMQKMRLASSDANNEDLMLEYNALLKVEKALDVSLNHRAATGYSQL